MEKNTTTGSHISVIIPVYNEVGIINDAVRHVRDIAGEPVEIVISDGGPDHRTLAAIKDADVVKVECLPGRGRQMNAGAACATGEILLFLHADTRLPAGAFASMRHAIADGAVGGSFSLAIDSPRFSLQVVAWVANVRSRAERVPYGDQAQFVSAETFHDLGGYADIPIMEDVELFQRIREQGLPISILGDKVVTSARRWDREGVFRRTLTNWWLRIRYGFGASPQTLVRHYVPSGSEGDE